MDRKLVLLLGLTGAVPPLVGNLVGGSPLVAVLLWTALAGLVWVPLVLRARESEPFLTVLLVGVAAGVVAGLVDLVFYGDPMLIIFALVAGTVWGALFGGIAFAVRRMRAA